MKTFILFAALILAACNSVHSNANNQANKATTPTPARAAATQHADGVKRVTTVELDELMKQGKVVVVDVRNKDAYDRGHIPGSKLIPVGDVGQRFKELPRDKMIVTYCA